jgi:hypothetical protein
MVLAPVLLLTACGTPSADYAQAACGEISELLEIDSRSQAQAEEFLTRAAARAQRAANTDGSFRDLYEDMSEIRDAVRAEDALEGVSERDASRALADVGAACDALGSPVQPVPLGDMTVSELARS